MADFALQTNAQGFISSAPARLIANNFDVRALRTNALLRKDEWRSLDTAVITVARQRLAVVEDLRSRGLIHSLGGLGVLVDEYEKVSDMTPADQSMAGVTEGEFDTPEFELASVPIPITHKDFFVNVRRLQASRSRGSSIDVVSAELAGAVVAEKLEDTVINGSSVRIGGNIAYGFRNFPQRATGNLTVSWNDPATTGAQIMADVLAMVAEAEAMNYNGPYMLYVGTAYNGKLREDFKANGDKTIRDRILEIDAIQGIRSSARMPANEVVLVQLTSNVVQLSVGQDITTVEWSEMGGFVQRFRVFAAMAPRLKADHKGQTGIVHYSA